MQVAAASTAHLSAVASPSGPKSWQKSSIRQNSSVKVLIRRLRIVSVNRFAIPIIRSSKAPFFDQRAASLSRIQVNLPDRPANPCYCDRILLANTRSALAFNPKRFLCHQGMSCKDWGMVAAGIEPQRTQTGGFYKSLFSIRGGHSREDRLHVSRGERL